jgi:hypothetical protein
MKSYISPEFKYLPVSGTLRVREIPSIVGKSLKMPNNINLDDQNLVWFQNLNGEQLNSDIESFINSYSTFLDKDSNHKIYLNKNQSNLQLDSSTSWIIDINIIDILRNYLFAVLKSFRSFNGLTNGITPSKNVDSFIKEWIESNIINKYELVGVNLYIEYVPILGGDRLKYSNKFKKISDDTKILRGFLLERGLGNILIKFKQEKPSNLFTFDYYFVLDFKKI